MAKQKRKTLESFTDPVGQEYRPGDVVAISIIDQRSPRTVYGIVQNTFPENSKGEEIVETRYEFDPETKRGVIIKTPACHVQVRVQSRTRWTHGSDGEDKLHTYQISSNITKINN